MATVYKRTEDKDKKRAKWYFCYTDHTGFRRTRSGFTDKKKTEQLAANLEYQALQRKLELIDPDKERLVAEKNRPILEHIEDFETSLAKQTPKYRKLIINRIKLMVSTGKLETMASVTIAEVEKAIHRICKKKEAGYKTYNHYVDACFAFCNWLHKKAKRIPSNPIDGIEKLNAEEDVRHPRRALTAKEFACLVHSARSSGVSIQCYDGETRSRIYILSYMTGLRRSELASLTPESFSLTSEQPILTVEAAHSKHRRKDVLPLHPELVAMLCEWLADVEPSTPLFPKLAKRRTWLMVKKDLERVGIPYKTAGGIADFHAAGRHTHITELLRNGASLVEAKELARHSDIKMTMKYTHIGMDDQAKALGNLPVNGLAQNQDIDATPIEDDSEAPKSQEWLRSASRDANGHEVAKNGNQQVMGINDETPVTDRGYHQNSSSDNDCQKWRRRESNPRAAITPRKLLRV